MRPAKNKKSTKPRKLPRKLPKGMPKDLNYSRMVELERRKIIDALWLNEVVKPAHRTIEARGIVPVSKRAEEETI